MKETLKIAYLFNRRLDAGESEAEFDSEETIRAVQSALLSGGHQVFGVEMDFRPRPIDPSLGGIEDTRDWIKKLREINPDIVFNTAEGFCGGARESVAPAILDQLQIAYVGSGAYGAFVSLDKQLAKQLVAAVNVPVADGYLVQCEADLADCVQRMEGKYPLFVKPNEEGSSKGISESSICADASELRRKVGQCLREYSGAVLVEQFIEGLDLSVPFIGGCADEGVLEPFSYTFLGEGPGKGIYDFRLKNEAEDHVSVECPALVSESVRAAILSFAKRVVTTLRLRDMARLDFRLSTCGKLYFLEANAFPSLQKDAGIFLSARRLGFSFDETILAILNSARARLRHHAPRIAIVYNLKRQTGLEEEAEFDDLSTIQAIRSAITALGNPVFPLEADRQLVEKLKQHRIDVVFNLAEGHSKRTREAQVPAICDFLGIEHTGSDTTCLSLTLDKALTKYIVEREGILTPRHRTFNHPDIFAAWDLGYPVIVKPNAQGTSKGIGPSSVCRNETELRRELSRLYRSYPEAMLCEEYIVGREITVGLLGNAELTVFSPREIVFLDDIPFPVYGFQAKQSDPNPHCRFEKPALTRDEQESLKKISKKIYRILGCRDLARLDFRLTRGGEWYFLEINALPGLAPGFSDYAVMAAESGIPYDRLIEKILAAARSRWAISSNRWALSEHAQDHDDRGHQNAIPTE